MMDNDRIEEITLNVPFLSVFAQVSELSSFANESTMLIKFRRIKFVHTCLF